MVKLGPYWLYTIETGRFRLDGGAMFGIVPKSLWERRIQADERNRISLALRCLLLEGPDRLILIDSGTGDKYDGKFRDHYALDHSETDLLRALDAEGFGPADVTDVILTHLHFDHGGGCTRRDQGRLVPTFPNARYHVQRAHWEWATHPNARERASFLPENLEPLAASGQLNLLDGAGAFLPGIELIRVDGHTEAQQLVKMTGPEGTLLYTADLLPTHVHLRAAWVMGYDVRPLVTLEEKAAILEQAVREGWHLFFEHDADVVVASLEDTGRGIETRAHRPLEELV